MKLKAIKGDITKLAADAIVNAANKSLLGGGGVDGAIHRAAGSLLQEECKALGGCQTGEAKITQGYNLPARFVIHTVGPIYGQENGRESELLASCYSHSLELAQKNNLKTIVFPSISTGAYGYPIEEAAKVAVKTVKEFITSHYWFDKIIFVLFSDNDLEVYKNELGKQ